MNYAIFALAELNPEGINLESKGRYNVAVVNVPEDIVNSASPPSRIRFFRIKAVFLRESDVSSVMFTRPLPALTATDILPRR